MKKTSLSNCIFHFKKNLQLNSVSGLEEVSNVPIAEEHKESHHKDTEETNEEVYGCNEEPKEVSVDPVYAKFLRMVQVGVPVQAVRMKMISEGLDPSVLE